MFDYAFIEKKSGALSVTLFKRESKVRLSNSLDSSLALALKKKRYCKYTYILWGEAHY